jgi:prevent-host-death family protein
MNTKPWPLQDAKARFSELVETCLKEGPQMVTRRGEETAVLVSAKEWKRLTHSRPSLKDILLAEDGPRDIPVSERGKLRWRKPPEF